MDNEETGTGRSSGEGREVEDKKENVESQLKLRPFEG